jgi:hypothetical protein
MNHEPKEQDLASAADKMEGVPRRPTVPDLKASGKIPALYQGLRGVESSSRKIGFTDFLHNT